MTGTDAILRTYERATPQQVRDGLLWYPTALTFAHGLARRHSLPHTDTGAGILAALSPQQSWGANQRSAESLCAARTAPATGANIRKALRILDGEDPLTVLGGNKVRAFYECIRTGGHTDVVCVDRHAADVALGRPTSAKPLPSGFLTDKRYRIIQDAYRLAAEETPHTPAQLQAICWIVRRHEKHGPGRYGDHQ